jgi:hypothetical protein
VEADAGARRFVLRRGVRVVPRERRSRLEHDRCSALEENLPRVDPIQKDDVGE